MEQWEVLQSSLGHFPNPLVSDLFGLHFLCE